MSTVQPNGDGKFSSHEKKYGGVSPRLPMGLAVAILWLLLLSVEWMTPGYFLHDDNATYFTPCFVHDFRTLMETGRLAEVNLYQYGGEPFLEQGQTAVLYPPVYIGVALAKWVSGDVRWTIEWLVAMHLTFGLLGFYYWLKQGGVSPRLAAAGSLAWVLNPFVLIVASSWVHVSFVACYLPWLFWSLDRVLARNTATSALGLGAILGLFFLQGYVQWVVYSCLFLGAYLLFHLAVRTCARPLVLLGHLALSAAVFFLMTAPLLLPMWHATDASIGRAQPLPLGHALAYAVHSRDLMMAQVLAFQPDIIYTTSSVIFFLPPLLLFPWMIFRFTKVNASVRRRLFPLLFLSALALLISSRWHIFLSILPLFNRFRWPFKNFVFVEFFILAALVWTAASCAMEDAPSPPRRWTGGAVCLMLVVSAMIVIALANHHGNYFSQNGLPTTSNPLPPGVQVGTDRVIAIEDFRYDSGTSYRFFTHAYGTLFQVPSLGGYDLLLSRERFQFGESIDIPNVFYTPITPDIRRDLDEKSVRYWMIRPDSEAGKAAVALDHLRLLSSQPGEWIYENTAAAPLAYLATTPPTPCGVSYAGNSILVTLPGSAGTVGVSVEPNDGWRYRLDHGSWLDPLYENNRLWIKVLESNKQLEISYFDPRFREGLLLSLGLGIVLSGIMALLTYLKRLRPNAAG